MNIKIKIICLVNLLFLVNSLFAKDVLISTPNNSILLSAPIGEDLKFLYYGNRLTDTDIITLSNTEKGKYSAYPVYGINCSFETALAVKHSDGNVTLQLEVAKVETIDQDDAVMTVISLKDKVYPFYVKVCYKAYQDVDIIETWTEISHQENKTVTLNQFSSAYIPIRKGNVWLSSLYGVWANEAQLLQEPLLPGMKIIKNKDGVRNSHTAHSEVMFSLDGQPLENTGRVIGAALCYSGNYKLRIDTQENECHHFFAGINEENSTYYLKTGEVFKTPELALTYSDKGLGGTSRNFHQWARLHKLANGTKLRKILLNSWEGVYFRINETAMNQMISDISSMGGELFVMDDGWFGDKYPRNSDRTSLGDWVINREKLPSGIKGLIDEAKSKNIKFGIWIEPEMTNIKSELYEKHPDWVLKAPKRDIVYGRGGSQMVLDLGNPGVQDFVFDVVNDLMTEYPEIDYIKWDANIPILNHGSHYLKDDEQTHMYIAYHRGLEKICQRIRSKYPDVTIQACASGGGRVNYGLLPYFDEFWTSDNTDALQRIYMQWGTSYFFPAIAMGSHISASPNHQTFRTVPMKFRIDVAMSGRLGMEIQPKDMTDAEKELCRKAITEYKEIRPVVQLGDLYRLCSPYDKLGLASLMYVSSEKDKAVFYWWKLEHFYNHHLPRVKMAGLNSESNYRIRELNRIDKEPLSFEGQIFSGAYLMANGLEIPYNHIVDRGEKNEYSSRILYLEKVLN